jgi:hypothetical protein
MCKFSNELNKDLVRMFLSNVEWNNNMIIRHSSILVIPFQRYKFNSRKPEKIFLTQKTLILYVVGTFMINSFVMKSPQYICSIYLIKLEWRFVLRWTG